MGISKKRCPINFAVRMFLKKENGPSLSEWEKEKRRRSFILWVYLLVFLALVIVYLDNDIQQLLDAPISLLHHSMSSKADSTFLKSSAWAFKKMELFFSSNLLPLLLKCLL